MAKHPPPSPKNESRAARAERLARALRDNLRRRKAAGNLDKGAHADRPPPAGGPVDRTP